MNDERFQERLARLMEQMNALPESERERLRQLAQEARERHERIKADVARMQESLDFLRMGMKYLLFDLEATRRERDTAIAERDAALADLLNSYDEEDEEEGDGKED